MHRLMLLADTIEAERLISGHVAQLQLCADGYAFCMMCSTKYFSDYLSGVRVLADHTAALSFWLMDVPVNIIMMVMIFSL